MVSNKKVSFKQRIRKNDLRMRNKFGSELKKRMGVSNRRHNRFDHLDVGGRTMEELVHEVEDGNAIASRDLELDPRALANLLMRPDEKGARKLQETPLTSDDPNALPEVEAGSLKNTNDDSGNGAKNKNRYKHRGQPYVFWDRIGLHPLLISALKAMHFTHPTPIQEEAVPEILSIPPPTKKGGTPALMFGNRKQLDAVVSAETGSGKTLVFALPVLHNLLVALEKEALARGEVPPQPPTAEEMQAALEATKAPRATTVQKRDRRGVALSYKGRTDGKRSDKGEVPPEADEGEEANSDGEKSLNEEEEALAAPKKPQPPIQRVMHTLVISPTRELALQIRASMLQLSAHAPHVEVGCLVGGMAPEKQQRILNRCPHILICTPGRLWELVKSNEGCYLGHSISRRVKTVVLDEADKLLQSGRFEELKMLLDRIHCDILPAGYTQEREEDAEAKDAAAEGMEAGRWDEERQEFVPFSEEEKIAAVHGQTDRVRRRKDQPRPMPMPPAPEDTHRVVTFLTSATLSLQTTYERKDFRSKKSIIRTSNANTMNHVLQELGMHAKTVKIFNQTADAGVVAKINETFLRCPDESKDLYLYYFLRTYKERTIIFVNAISMLRRLTKLLEVLGIPVVGLHASMQQRQRLKFIDRFKEGSKRVLVATDIASRGLDIEGLKYVIHFQVPRSTDAYIHRCGRTARCGGTGTSVMMVNAAEHMSFKKLLESMGRKENSMEVFALEPTVVHHLQPHVKVALQIDKLQREIDKTSASNHWVTRMSKEADIDADDMINNEASAENREKMKAIKVLKKRLEVMVLKDSSHRGGKGSFRSSAQALGALSATEKMRDRARRQAILGPQK